VNALRQLSEPAWSRIARRRNQGLPRAHQTEPVRGVKLATLGLERPYDLATVHFVGVRRPFEQAHRCDEGDLCYRAKATASCATGASHRAPDERCQCGFYAFRPDARLASHLRPRSGQWLLEVRLSGKVVVHEHGYRAERQRVIAITPPTRCVCERGAPTVVIAQGRGISAVCVACAAEAISRHGALALRVSRLEEILEVPVRRHNLCDEWLELVESGLLTRQVDPSVPVVSQFERVVRIRDTASGGVSEIRTDRSDVLGQWMMNLIISGGLTKGQLELTNLGQEMTEG